MTRAGPEIGVASTKAFTTQLTALADAGHRAREASPARTRRRERQHGRSSWWRFRPGICEKTLGAGPDEHIHELSGRFADKHHTLFLGRGAMHPVAMEGALKLKEISYIHAEAYAAGELKHGPLALVDADMPVIAVAPNTRTAREAEVEPRWRCAPAAGSSIVFADPDSGFESSEGVTVITMPKHVTPFQAPLVYTVPLQLLSYHVAILKGTDVDQPRNLAKSVTVE
jgi:glutamine---fructose-6-phosphate transaminase (isomerizing)